jgi:hypothetical protein
VVTEYPGGREQLPGAGLAEQEADRYRPEEQADLSPESASSPARHALADAATWGYGNVRMRHGLSPWLCQGRGWEINVRADEPDAEGFPLRSAKRRAARRYGLVLRSYLLDSGNGHSEQALGSAGIE